MGTKTWNDQPDEVQYAVVVGTFALAYDTMAEVRVASNLSPVTGEAYGNRPTVWYLTVSHYSCPTETLKCKDAATVLAALCVRGKAWPDGSELLPNA